MTAKELAEILLRTPDAEVHLDTSEEEWCSQDTCCDVILSHNPIVAGYGNKRRIILSGDAYRSWRKAWGTLT